MYISVLPQKDFTVKCPKPRGVSLNMFLWFLWQSYIQDEVIAVVAIKKISMLGRRWKVFIP